MYDALGAAGVTALRFYEFWMMGGNVDPRRPNATVSAAYNPLLNCSAAAPAPPADGRCAKVSGPPYHPIPDLEFAVAAFLVAQAPYSYFGASSGWYSTCWCYLDVYDRAAACGAPSGPAVRTGAYTWRRAFRGCAVAVDAEAGTGSIVYNS